MRGINITRSLVFNGVELCDIGGASSSIVVRKQILDKPKRRQTKLIIPGRNGTRYINDEYFENVSVSYTLVFQDFSKSDALLNYLLAQKGFCRLEDEYDRDTYRMARVSGGMRPDTPDFAKGFVVIEFECLPERWLKASVNLTASPGLTARNVDDMLLCRAVGTGVDGGTYVWKFNGYGWTADFGVTWTNGYILSDGEKVNASTYQCTEFIPVRAGDKIMYTLSTGNTSRPVIGFYGVAPSYTYDDTKSVYAASSGYLSGVYTAPANGNLRLIYQVARSDNIYVGLPVDLADYGLTVTGTPASGDILSATITNPSVITLRDNSSISLINPTQQTAKPRFLLKQVPGAPIICEISVIEGTTTLYKVDVDETAYGVAKPIYVDSEREDCYFDSGANANPYCTISTNGFPVFRDQPIQVGIIANGTRQVGDVELEPRWWKL